MPADVLIQPSSPVLGLLQQRPFRMYSYARFWSRVAQNAVNFGLVLLIVDKTELAAMSSLLVLALVIPSTVAGIVAGSAADRFPKRILSSLGDGARGGICILFAQGAGGVVSFYIVAVALSTATQFATAAQGSMGPLIVQRHELTRANAINQAVGGAAQLVGLGILTPIVLRLFDSPTLLFWIAGALFFLSAVQIQFVGRVRSVRTQEVGEPPDSGGFWTVGWRAIRRDNAVWHAIVELTLIGATLIILGGLLPSYISEVLDLPVDIGAVILSPAAAGVALGLRVASFLARRVPHAVLSTAGFASFVVLLLALTFVQPEARFLAGFGVLSWLDDVHIGSFDGAGVLAIALTVPLGFSFAIVNVAGNTVINDRIPLHLQGRVQATQGALAAIASSLPVLLAGFLADILTVVPVMAMVAIGIGAAAVVNLRAALRERSNGPAEAPA
ncbi:MAG: MFS transporter [Dehalococcoidia bacterium]